MHEAEWVEGLVTEECPVLWLPEMMQVIHAHRYASQGILPHAGGWADQPAVLMQMVEHFNNEVPRG